VTSEMVTVVNLENSDIRTVVNLENSDIRNGYCGEPGEQ